MDKIETEQLVKLYRQSAKEHGDALDHVAANKAADVIAKAYAELRRRGIEHQRQLLPLLSDISANVRQWSASHALEFAPELGEPILERLCSAKGAVGVSASITLDVWRAGELRFP